MPDPRRQLMPINDSGRCIRVGPFLIGNCHPLVLN
jgi:hypothetical protein